MSDFDVLDEVERLKAESRFLRGTLEIGLEDPVSGAIAESDTKLIKFHGIYQQDDRDQRKSRRQALLEPLYSFMLRVRIPGGVLRPAQWLALEALANTHGNGTLRLTTRQAVQFHGVFKENLRPLVRGLEEAGLDSIAACGDVNRNVICSPNPLETALHAQVQRWTEALSDRLLPQSNAYREIWLDNSRGSSAAREAEPLYGSTYLPRKFKIAVAVPPLNDVDVFAHDLGFIAIHENGRLAGFNITVGGGMGASHDDPHTFPRLADVIGFLPTGVAQDVAEAVVSIQRDYGNRQTRRYARLKYTIETHGLDWFLRELEWRLPTTLQPARPFRFEHNGDRYGWVERADGRWNLTLFVENGRLGVNALAKLREAIAAFDGELRITPNQNLMLANVSGAAKPRLETLLADGLEARGQTSPLRRHAMACVAFPTCALAMAESERYLPSLLDLVEARLAAHGIGEAAITIRMTGCPNGCARPYLAEIGLVGKAPGRYNLHLGGAFDGTRLNRLYRENANEAEIIDALDPLFARYAAERHADETFGDFVIRVGLVQPVKHGKEVRESAA